MLRAHHTHTHHPPSTLPTARTGIPPTRCLLAQRLQTQISIHHRHRPTYLSKPLTGRGPKIRSRTLDIRFGPCPRFVSKRDKLRVGQSIRQTHVHVHSRGLLHLSPQSNDSTHFVIGHQSTPVSSAMSIPHITKRVLGPSPQPPNWIAAFSIQYPQKKPAIPKDCGLILRSKNRLNPQIRPTRAPRPAQAQARRPARSQSARSAHRPSHPCYPSSPSGSHRPHPSP